MLETWYFHVSFFVSMSSHVFGLINFLQTLVVDFIIKSNNFPFICYCENLTLVGLEFHGPSLLSLNKCSGIFFWLDYSIDVCVTSKKAYCWWNYTGFSQLRGCRGGGESPQRAKNFLLPPTWKNPPLVDSWPTKFLFPPHQKSSLLQLNKKKAIKIYFLAVV